jgi:hypothetical protein
MDFQNFQIFTKIMIFEHLLAPGPACLGWIAWGTAGKGWLGWLSWLAGGPGWGARGGRRKQYFEFYSTGKPNRQFILVWPPTIVGSGVSMHLTILLDNNRNPEKKSANGLGWAGWLGCWLAGWFP